MARATGGKQTLLVVRGATVVHSFRILRVRHDARVCQGLKNVHYIVLDTSVQSFQAWSATQVFVLGINGNLWLESAPFGEVPPARVEVDASVQSFQASCATEAVVLGTNGILWLESGPFGIVLPPTRVEIDADVA